MFHVHKNYFGTYNLQLFLLLILACDGNDNKVILDTSSDEEASLYPVDNGNQTSENEESGNNNCSDNNNCIPTESGENEESISGVYCEFIDDDLAHFAVIQHVIDVVIMRQQGLWPLIQLRIHLYGLWFGAFMIENAKARGEAQTGERQNLVASGH